VQLIINHSNAWHKILYLG